LLLKKINGLTAKTGLLVLAAVLLFLNFLNALDLAGHARESATGVACGTLAKAAGLKSRIAELEKSRAKVPQFTFTSAAMVSAAQAGTYPKGQRSNAERWPAELAIPDDIKHDIVPWLGEEPAEALAHEIIFFVSRDIRTGFGVSGTAAQFRLPPRGLDPCPLPSERHGPSASLA
jgi:hypothetical protein